jgi:hypothetical protein
VPSQRSFSKVLIDRPMRVDTWATGAVLGTAVHQPLAAMNVPKVETPNSCYNYSVTTECTMSVVRVFGTGGGLK